MGAVIESKNASAPTPPPGGKAGAKTRRGFLARLWMILGGVVVAEYALVTMNLLRPRSRSTEVAASAIFVAGPVERFEPGSVTAFPAGRFYLARLDEGGFLALSRVCTHLGCTVPWDAASRSFVCPCHASSYDIRGCVVTPPAPRPLDVYPVRIENGIVKVDIGRTVRRHAFEMSHVTYA